MTRNYINPSIDIIKSRNNFSSNTMNATLLAMTNSAAESFIIMNSIFFNVSDIGVYTVVGETAFYALIIQGAFYIVTDIDTKIDWWIITRETIFLLFYICLFSGFLIDNKIEVWKAGILLGFYFVHIIMMVLNQYYEVAIKKAVARHYELKEKNAETVYEASRNSSRKITCQQLADIKINLKEDCIVHENQQYREKANARYLKIYQKNEHGKGVAQLRRLVSRIILLIQVYKLNMKVQRSKRCKTDLSKVIKFYEYCESDSDNTNNEELESYDASKSEKGSILPKKANVMMSESGQIGSIRHKEDEDDSISKNEAEKEFDEFEDDLSSNEEQEKTIYDKINERVNKKVSIMWPKKFKEQILYVLQIPLTHPQYFTVPNPMTLGRENFYPLTLFMSISWIYAYTFIIVWWTFELSKAWGINYSIIPLIVYPIGISIRDRKKISDFIEVNKLFKEELEDQEISLAETFSGPIFQLTGLVGFTWLIQILLSGKTISFENSNIQFQAPLLLICIALKYISVAVCKFRTKKKLFVFNSVVYFLFTLTALVIDYYDSF